MLNHLKNEANIAYTENGAVTNASTMSDCLDLFATIGAIRAAKTGRSSSGLFVRIQRMRMLQ